MSSELGYSVIFHTITGLFLWLGEKTSVYETNPEVAKL